MIVNKHHILAPTQIIDTQLGIPQGYKQKCISEIYKIGNSIESTPNQKSNLHAIRSTYKVWEETEVLNQLLDNIVSTINNIYKDEYKDMNFILENAWGAIYKKDSYANSHKHLPDAWAFVYYLKSNGDTPLIFNEINLHVNPKDDMLLVFPSYLIHSVPPHEGDEDRICIAGNIGAIKNN